MYLSPELGVLTMSQQEFALKLDLNVQYKLTLTCMAPDIWCAVANFFYIFGALTFARSKMVGASPAQLASIYKFLNKNSLVDSALRFC